MGGLGNGQSLVHAHERVGVGVCAEIECVTTHHLATEAETALS